MSKATTHEQRKFIENKVKEGWPSSSIAESLGISIKTVNKWRQRIKKKAVLFRKWAAPNKEAH